MVKCVFCGKDEAFMKGLNLINNDGSVSYFCSGKCRKNALKLRRDKKKLKWTEAYRLRIAKEKAKNAKEVNAEKTTKKEDKKVK